MTFYPVSYSNVATFFLLKRRRACFSSWKGITPLPMFYSPLFLLSSKEKKSVCVCVCVYVCWKFKFSIVFMKKYVLVNQMCSLHWGFGSWEIYLHPISELASGVIFNRAEESLRWTAGVWLIWFTGWGLTALASTVRLWGCSEKVRHQMFDMSDKKIVKRTKKMMSDWNITFKVKEERGAKLKTKSTEQCK